MPLYKRSGSAIWWANISVPGRPRLRRSTGEIDEVKAQRRHDEFKVEVWKEDPALRGDTWGRAVEKWVAAEERSDSELLSLAKFGRSYPDRMLAKVTPESIDQALGFCRTAGTYTRYRTMIAAILNMAGCKVKLLSRRDKKTKSRSWLTQEQWACLYAELPAHMKPMAEFAISTGLRQANVLGLAWSRVDLARKVVWVEAEDTKADQALTVPLSKDAMRVLADQVGQHPEFVFTYRGKPVGEIKTAFQAACLRAQVGVLDGHGRYHGFTWHGFRHTWATWHIQNGTPIEVLQKLGGWSDLRMVMNYAHHSPGHLASFADNVRQL
jgi:integrase